MAERLEYLVNFPRENAEKYDPFEGSEELEKELLGRKIIGLVEFVESKAVMSGMDALKEQVKTLKSEKESSESENAALKEQVKTLEAFVEASKDTNKNSYPDGYEEYKANKAS